MKRGSVLSAGLLALALMTSACSPSSNPTTALGTPPEQVNGPSPGILAALDNPEVMAAPVDAVTYRLLFTAGASGTSDSDPMVAARTIETVDFEIRAPGGELLAAESAREVVTTGVMGDENVASLTVFADTEWAKTIRLEKGTYLIGYVRGRNGEQLVLRADVPVRDAQ